MKASNQHYRATIDGVRKHPFVYVVANGKIVNSKWGADIRTVTLDLYEVKPGCYLFENQNSHFTSFARDNVNKCFDNLESVFE